MLWWLAPGWVALPRALAIQKAGLTVAVLEARDRVGGKTITKDLASSNGHVDVRAAWLNDSAHPKLYALAKNYGFDTVVQRTAGNKVVQGMHGKVERHTEDRRPFVSVASFLNIGCHPAWLDRRDGSFPLVRPRQWPGPKASLILT
jgi:monoamine oxidase